MFTVIQDRLKDVIDGITDEDDDNTKLSESLQFEMQIFRLARSDRTFLSSVFAILAQRDEIAKLKLQKERETQTNQEKIKGGRLVYPKRIQTCLMRRRSFRFCQRSGGQSGGVQTAD